LAGRCPLARTPFGPRRPPSLALPTVVGERSPRFAGGQKRQPRSAEEQNCFAYLSTTLDVGLRSVVDIYI